MKSERNKTIDTSVEEGYPYLERCITVESLSGCTDKFLLDRIILGDTFEVMPLLQKDSVDLIIADPPYNLTKTYSKTTFKKQNMDEYEEYTVKWLDLSLALLKTGGTMYICCDWESSLIIGNVLNHYQLAKKLIIRNRITWQREKGRGAKLNWKNGMEDIWFITKGSLSDGYTFNLDSVKLRRKVLAPYHSDSGEPKDWEDTSDGKFRDTCPSNFWDDITIPFWSMAENTAHPTQKSEKLIAKLILASSNEGDTVFDPFLGSGTTAVTAKKLNRHYIGIEREEQYCIWAQERLEMADSDTRIQGYENGVFWERHAMN